jgi:hypothetical protein
VDPQEQSDDVLVALDELEAVLKATSERNRMALRRARAIRELRERGLPYSEIVPLEERPLVVELLTHTLNDLSDAGSSFRRVEARALYSEGLTMPQIAKLFGVTRQRIAALLRPTGAPDGRSQVNETLHDLSAVLALAYHTELAPLLALICP